MENIKPLLIVIAGPTASGKTAIAIALCKRIDGEVVSADSMQVYRGMDIGTAKPTLAERAGVPHHMLDAFPVGTCATVSSYTELAKKAIDDILRRGKTPVLCGGTGLYIDALTRPMRFSVPADEVLREELRRIAAQSNGKAALHRILEQCDPESAARLHKNDVRRVIRAIESFRLSGKTLAQHAAEDSLGEADYNALLFAPQWPRDVLYARIDARVEQMLENGLIDEVRSLLAQGLQENTTAMQAIGYKEVVQALRDGIEPQHIALQIQKASRNYAKRQCTWLRRDGRVHFLPAAQKDANALAEEILSLCKKEGIHL